MLRHPDYTRKLAMPASRAVYCNGLEDEADAAALDGDTLTVPYRPYQIITIKLA
jgi:hypothetical protein